MGLEGYARERRVTEEGAGGRKGEYALRKKVEDVPAVELVEVPRAGLYTPALARAPR